MTQRVFLIGLLPAFAFLLCCGDPPPEPQAANAAPNPGNDKRVAVRTVVMEPERFEERLRVTGVLVPYDEVDLAAELGGFVREVLFDKGDRVELGQVLARIGDDLAESQLEQARAELMAAQTDFEKTSLLFDREAVPQQDLDDATAERDRAQARVREMEIRLERSIIRAPIGGVAQSRLIEPGEVVAPGTRVTTLQRSDRLKVQANVPDTEIAWLARGRSAQIRVDAYPDRVFEARLSYLAPAADTQTRTFEVECDLPNHRRLLRPGMLARVELVKRTVEDGLVVPIDAVVQAREGLVAYVVEDCAARSRPVVTGAAEGDRVLVEEGLQAGERLVVEGQRDLSDGQPVRGEGCP